MPASGEEGLADELLHVGGDETAAVVIFVVTLPGENVNEMLLFITYDGNHATSFPHHIMNDDSLMEKPRVFAPRGRVALTPSGEIVLTL